MADVQAKLQVLSEEFTKLQQGLVSPVTTPESQPILTGSLELQETVQSRQKLEAQKQENLGVQKVGSVLRLFSVVIASTDTLYKELSKLKDDETIYKLIGPVLLKQERVEAESTVKGRLDFIEKEM